MTRAPDSLGWGSGATSIYRHPAAGYVEWLPGPGLAFGELSRS